MASDKPTFDFSKLSFNFGGEGTTGGFKFDLQQALSSHLNDLVGQSSGYIESLPKEVQNRVRALEKIQEEHLKIEDEFEEEVRQLEMKYYKRHKPLWERRYAIVSGQSEPTPEETVPEEEPKIVEIKEENKEEKKEEPKTEETVKGIPDFWLNALKHNTTIGLAISEKDEEILKHLQDISYEYVEDENSKANPGSFALTFKFAQNNPYLVTNVLKKTYYLRKEEGSSDTICESIDTTEIEWKEGKDPTTKGGELGAEGSSFFLFFNPPDIKEGTKPTPQMAETMGLDFEMAVELKDRVIHHAVSWFTGDAVDDEDEDMRGFRFGGEDDEEDDDEDGDGDDGEGGEDEDSDQEWKPKANQKGNKDPPPECKQQ